jgi:class 3 adenylate cyclase
LLAGLAALAEPREILISTETAQRLDNRFPLHSRGKQQHKHVKSPVLVYHVCMTNADPLQAVSI